MPGLLAALAGCLSLPPCPPNLMLCAWRFQGNTAGVELDAESCVGKPEEGGGGGGHST